MNLVIETNKIPTDFSGGFKTIHFLDKIIIENNHRVRLNITSSSDYNKMLNLKIKLEEK